MAWSVDYIEELDIVQQSWSGHTVGSDFKAAAIARVALGREKGTSTFLIDATDIICEKSVLLDLLEVADKVLAELGADRACRIAVLGATQPGSEWVTSFYEDISVNRGWTVRTFFDRDAAIAWLTG